MTFVIIGSFLCRDDARATIFLPEGIWGKDYARDVADVSKLDLENSRLPGTLTEPLYFCDARLAFYENDLGGWIVDGN